MPDLPERKALFTSSIEVKELKFSIYVLHLSILLLIAAVLFLKPTLIPQEMAPLTHPQVRRYALLPSQLGAESGKPDFLFKAAVPHTTIPERPRKDILIYRIQPGDTLYGIGQKFGISGETVMWANPALENNPDMLRLGQELIILPVSGVYHTVQPGETVESIASKYKVEPEAITDFELNGLEEPFELEAGRKLVVPGGVKPYVPRVVHHWEGPIPEDAQRGTGNFGWPVSGTITQGYWGGHRAVDIGAWKGAPVYAADSGYVVMAGWSNQGYGYFVLLDHGNGFQTLYAHLSGYYVKVGQSVAKGEKIGAVGATGYATGYHLHFEIRKDGVQRNPLGFLP